MDNITKKIAGYASSLSFNNLDEATRHAATQRLIDALGCGLGAHDCEPAQIGRRLSAGETPGKYAGRVLFYGDRLPAESAGFINTTMIRNFDFNDRYPGGHPSDALGAADRARQRHAGRRQALPRRHERDVRDLRAAVRIRRSSAGAAGTRALPSASRPRPASATCSGCRCRRPPTPSASRRARACRCGSRAPASSRRGRASPPPMRRATACSRRASPPKAWRDRAMRSKAGQGCSRTSPGRSRSSISRPKAARR